MYESFAYEMALLYQQMDQVYRSAFIDTASGLQLEMVAAILGIRRGLPDFAEGEVTFERDAGQDDLEIPLGTLVTTEDSEKAPRKAYKTIETKLLPATATAVNVKVQALDPGEDQVVAAETIVVMPLPVAGVKAVHNLKPTQFLGKRLETDDDLRQRAKSMLLASGKASLTAIETALLSLPGVREVKVVEPFGDRYGVLDVYVDDRALDGLPPLDWLPQGAPGGAQAAPADAPAPALPPTQGSIQDRKRQQERVAMLRQHLDQVRAAGVYLRLGGSEPVEVDGLVHIALAAGADPKVVTGEVEGAIATHFARLGLGQPLLFPHLTQAMLAVPGVNNVEEFALIPRRQGQPLEGAPFLSRARRIETHRVASKFRLGQLAVVSEVQPLPVTVEFRTADLTAETYEQATTALRDWFQGLAAGQTITREAIVAQLPESTPAALESVVLTPHHPSPVTIQTAGELRPGFAEKPVLATPLLAYSAELDLVGALKVIGPEAATAAARQTLYAAIEARLQTYLNQLAPEQAVSLAALAQVATIEGLTVVPPNPADFSAQRDGAEVDRLDADTATLQVDPFERVRLTHLLLSDRPQPLAVEITALELALGWVADNIPNVIVVRVDDRTVRENVEDPATSEPPVTPPPTAGEANGPAREAEVEALKTALQDAIRTFPAQPPGQDFALAGLRQHLETTPDRLNQFRGLTLRVTELTAGATSVDGRQQTRALADTRPLQVRSLEYLAQLTPPATITVRS
ncbi:baseplate J/gp47 family protein [Nodosilinea sp. LEGE 06152]|nr:baseplate J/gp47 family protein [Nodosilinea sp. LEGE 06152]